MSGIVNHTSHSQEPENDNQQKEYPRRKIVYQPDEDEESKHEMSNEMSDDESEDG